METCKKVQSLSMLFSINSRDITINSCTLFPEWPFEWNCGKEKHIQYECLKNKFGHFIYVFYLDLFLNVPKLGS